MKKTTLILALLCILLNTSLMYTAPNNKQKKQSLNFSNSGNLHRQESVANGITEVDISVAWSGNGTISIDIPLSVKEVQLTGRVSGNSHIYLYARHNPNVTNNISNSGNLEFSLMHPIRKYTYHIAAFAAIGALAYYFTREK